MDDKYITSDFQFGFSGNNHTIEGAIKYYNPNISRDDLTLLVKQFNELNPTATPPRPGQVVKIPIKK